MEGIQQILNDWSERTKQELISTYRKKGLKASGAFENGLTVETSEMKTAIWTVPHTGAMVFGRKPSESGSKPGKLLDVIKQWIINKGITSELKPESLAYLITRKIHREGIKVPNLHNEGTLISSVINDNSISGLLSQMGIYIIKDIKTDIQKTWQQ